MRNISVCHLTTVHDSSDNRIYFKECAALADAGFNVTLIAPGVVLDNLENVSVVSIKKATHRVFRMLWISTIVAAFKALRSRCMIVHFHDPELIPTGLFLRACGKKVIYDVHENLPAAVLSKSYLGSIAMRRILAHCVNWAEKNASWFFNGLVTARPDISANFEHGNLCTLRNFPKLSDLKCMVSRTEIQKSKPAVIYVGGMTKIRGIRELIDAFQYVEEAELWLLGSFFDEEFLKECQGLPGWGRTRYFGKVLPYEIFGYIERADIGVVTFWPEPNHLTTLATKPFEYMAKGLPVVMSDFPYWRDFFGECGAYVNPKAPKDIAAAITFLLSDSELRRRIGDRNRELIENEYNWEVEQRRLLELYDRIIDTTS